MIKSYKLFYSNSLLGVQNSIEIVQNKKQCFGILLSFNYFASNVIDDQ